MSFEAAKAQIDNEAATSRDQPAHVSSGTGAVDVEEAIPLEYKSTDTALDLLKKHAAYLHKDALRGGPLTENMRTTLRVFEFQSLYGVLHGTPLPLVPLVNH